MSTEPFFFRDTFHFDVQVITRVGVRNDLPKYGCMSYSLNSVKMVIYGVI